MSAKDVFEEMKGFVDASCKAKNHCFVIQAAEMRGFHNLPTSSTSQVFANLKYQDASGGEVWLVAKWHDPSGPFQNLPDINRIRLMLKLAGLSSEEYMGEYED